MEAESWEAANREGEGGVEGRELAEPQLSLVLNTHPPGTPCTNLLLLDVPRVLTVTVLDLQRLPWASVPRNRVTSTE